MIGDQKTGAIEGVVISAVSHEGLSVTVDGRPAKLAVVTDDGQVIAVGKEVAREAAAVAVNNYRGFLKGQGFLRVFSAGIAKKN
jgi:ribose 5-phosphate isomerase RpiB